MARQYFGNRSPIGKRLLFDGDKQAYEIVGVVGDAKYLDAQTTLPTVYLDTFQEDWVASQFVLRSRVDPASLTAAVRRTISEVTKSVPIVRSTTVSRSNRRVDHTGAIDRNGFWMVRSSRRAADRFGHLRAAGILRCSADE